jgi:hypothetical protein
MKNGFRDFLTFRDLPIVAFQNTERRKKYLIEIFDAYSLVCAMETGNITFG